MSESKSIAIIGDVHGNVEALSGILRLVAGRFSHLVLVGDYVNRGPNSASVIQILIDRIKAGTPLTCVAGNHDLAFRRCLDEGKLIQFLRIGGAATIKSYVSTPDSDLLQQLQEAVPDEHKEFLRSLYPYFRYRKLLVTHSREDPGMTSNSFHVFGHIPQTDLRPKITANWAAIDTGCGTLRQGRLTCMLWPSLKVIQVDSSGVEINAQ